MRFMRFRSWLSIALVCFAASVVANPITTYQLKNGLRLIVKPDHRAPVAIFSIWYKVGGSYEHSGITGISHMLEHMMFMGTKQHPRGNFENTFESVGGQFNAMTSDDFTAYYEYLSAQHIPLCFKLEADRMHNLVLKQKDFAKEHQVVMEERRMRVDDNPQALTVERFNAAAYINNPYHHPTVGWMTDVAHLTLSDLKTWYHDWYQPNNAIIVIVGDVKPEAMHQLAQKYFSNIPTHPVPVVKPRTEVSNMGVRRVKVNGNAKTPWLLLGYNVPTIKTAPEAWQPYALLMLAGVLDAGDSARLQQQLVRQQQVASDVGASYTPLKLYSTVLNIYGTPAQGVQPQKLSNELMQQIKTLKTTLVSKQELARVKAQLIAQDIYKNDAIMSQALQIGSFVIVGLPVDLSQDYIKKLEQITPQQIQKVAQIYLTPNRLTIAQLQPRVGGVTHAH